jgi:hypothetical protein
MLSPLRRNGLHHRSVISLAVSASIFYSFILQVSPALPQSSPWPRVRFHSCHLHRTHIHIFEQRPSFVSKNDNLLTDIFPACLFFLHSPTTTPESKDASSLHTIPPATLKPKVELRPGPIKPPIAPSSSQSPRTKKLPTTNPSFHSQLTSSTAKPSNIIVETMKEDLKQAYIHGVLTRPPPGAGKVATLWHQAKELFVR